MERAVLGHRLSRSVNKLGWLVECLTSTLLAANVMAHAQKPDLVFRAKRTSPFKSAGGRQFSRLLAAEVCASAVVMLDTPHSEVV